ncbi:MAG: peptidylprolyl isomerase [Xanthomonadales bacterium]|nr:peptidylprolyl isomerase [Xanthomonadales bacterium]
MAAWDQSPRALCQRALLAIVGAAVLALPGAIAATEQDAAEEVRREVHVAYASPLLATRADAQITQAELDARMQSIPEDDRAAVLADPERIGQLVQDMLATEQVAREAIARGALDQHTVQAEIYRVISVRLADIQRTYVMENAELDDYTTQARELYVVNKHRYMAPPAISFTHLLIRDADDGSAEARVRELKARVDAGASLQELAAEFSEDPSVKTNQGYFDRSPVDRLDPAFREGTAEIEPGETGLVQSAYGWHLVRIDERIPARPQPFEEVADKLVEQARTAHLTRVWERYLRRVHAPELDIAPGAVASILERYGVRPNASSSPEADEG